MPDLNCPTTPLLGLVFADLDVPAAARLIAARDPAAGFAYVVTPNADHFARLFRTPSLWPLYRDAWLCLLDSRVVAGAARLLRLPTPKVAPGSDLTRLLLAEHLQPNERICIVGLEPAWLPMLVSGCGLAPPAHCFPPMGFDRQAETMQPVVDFVIAHPARLIFVAVGSPRQERLCAELARSGLVGGTALCVGASLEFLAGKKTRAPALMQRAGLEWLHRLADDPRRLTMRYLASLSVFVHLLKQRLRQGKMR